MNNSEIMISVNPPLEDLYKEDMELYINYAIDYLGGFRLCPDQEYVASIMLAMIVHYDLHRNKKKKVQSEKQYMKEIREGGKYAILFSQFELEDAHISEFIYIRSNKKMMHPPQSMCYVAKKSNF